MMWRTATSCTLNTAKWRGQWDMKRLYVKSKTWFRIMYLTISAFRPFYRCLWAYMLFILLCIYMASLAHLNVCFLLLQITRTGRQKRAHAAFSAILFLWSEKWKKTFTWSKKLEILLVFLSKVLRPWTR